MRSITIIAVLAIFVMASCSTLEKPRTGKTYETDDGLEITFIEKGEGPEADSGDVVFMHYTGKLENDSVFGSSYQRNQPFRFRLGNNEVIKGWEIGVDYMSEGDSALLKIPPELAYGERERGAIPANSTLRFMVRLEDVRKAPKPFDTTNATKKEPMDGLKIYTVKEGKGRQLSEGYVAKVHYTGYFEDGEVFDTSVEREDPIRVQLGKDQVIKGWEEALKTMRVGDKARIIIPPELAYGKKGRGQIEPNTTLIFDVEVLEAELPEKAVPYEVEGKDTVFTESGLGIIKVKETDNVMASKGNVVKVHYTGYFTDGEVFDSSVEAGKPISFELGKGQVIRGWDEGIQHMRVGEKARLIIPYQLGYGEQGAGPVPPKTKLIFDVHLLEVK
ncbi:MAG: FKBP-type peptidyl-prolyl cis-trans isomerase [Bacteroidota bacterium]